ALGRVGHHQQALRADACGARLTQRLQHAWNLHLTLDDVEHALRARLDAVGDLPAAGTAHEAEVRLVEQIRMAVAAPREAKAFGEKALAELDDARAAHREKVVVEEDVPDAHPFQSP